MNNRDLKNVTILRIQMHKDTRQPSRTDKGQVETFFYEKLNFTYYGKIKK